MFLPLGAKIQMYTGSLQSRAIILTHPEKLGLHYFEWASKGGWLWGGIKGVNLGVSQCGMPIPHSSIKY